MTKKTKQNPENNVVKIWRQEHSREEFLMCSENKKKTRDANGWQPGREQCEVRMGTWMGSGFVRLCEPG